MPDKTVFECGNAKCAYAIASEGLNRVQLLVLRRSAKTCPECGTMARFNEQTSLPNIQTKTSTSYGGTQYEKTTQNTHSGIPKTASQRRKATRHDGLH